MVCNHHVQSGDRPAHQPLCCLPASGQDSATSHQQTRGSQVGATTGVMSCYTHPYAPGAAKGPDRCQSKAWLQADPESSLVEWYDHNTELWCPASCFAFSLLAAFCMSCQATNPAAAVAAQWQHVTAVPSCLQNHCQQHPCCQSWQQKQHIQQLPKPCSKRSFPGAKYTTPPPVANVGFPRCELVFTFPRRAVLKGPGSMNRDQKGLLQWSGGTLGWFYSVWC